MQTKSTLILFLLLTVCMICRAQQWVTQNSCSGKETFISYCLSVANADNVWSIANSNIICATADGGNNWNSFNIPPGVGASWTQVMNTDTGWVATYDDSARIWKTTDGGASWEHSNTIGFHCDYFHFFNSNDGVTFSDPMNGTWVVFTTNDGGVSWVPANIPAPLTGENCMDGHASVFGDNIWITSTEGRIFHSTDKGQNWNVHTIQATTFPDIFRPAFFNDLDGIAVRYTSGVTNPVYGIYRTVDGGDTWNIFPFTGPIDLAFLGGLLVVPGSGIVISHGDHMSSFSSDTGLTWTLIDSTHNYGVLDAKDWNSLFTNQPSDVSGTGGMAKWDGTILNISNESVESAISVFPNPVSQRKVAVSFPLKKNSSTVISLFDLNGKEVLMDYSNGHAGPNTVWLDLTGISKGIYFMRITINEVSLNKKIVID